MTNRIVHPSTGFVEFFRTPEEEELAHYKDKVEELESELKEIKNLIRKSNSGDKNAAKD